MNIHIRFGYTDKRKVFWWWRYARNLYSMHQRIKIFNINFIDANYKTIKSLLEKGGLLVLPSGPGLSTIKDNTKYHKSLINSDIALFDSGYLCLLLRILKGIKVRKFSGFKFLN